MRKIPEELVRLVTQRDCMVCNYCGSVGRDHDLGVCPIIPGKMGGTIVPENLVLICKECHDTLRDKDNMLPPLGLDRLRATLATVRERQQILRDILEAEREEIRLKDGKVWVVAEEWCNSFGMLPRPGQPYEINKSFFGSLKKYLHELTVADMLQYIPVVVDKVNTGTIRNEYDARRYYCGIMRNILNQRRPEEPHEGEPTCRNLPTQ